MPVVTQKQREAILEEVRREFPGDEAMQELHFVRRIHQLETEGMSPSELIAYYEKGIRQPAPSRPGKP